MNGSLNDKETKKIFTIAVVGGHRYGHWVLCRGPPLDFEEAKLFTIFIFLRKAVLIRVVLKIIMCIKFNVNSTALYNVGGCILFSLKETCVKSIGEIIIGKIWVWE